MDALIEKEIIDELKKYIVAGKRKFVICPYGEWGHYVQEVLREHFSIQEIMILDNGIEGKSVQCLADMEMDEDTYILLATKHEEIYLELRDELLLYVSAEKVLNVGKNYTWITRMVNKNLEKHNVHDNECLCEMQAHDFVYRMESHNVKWYLPFYDTEIIQQRIFTLDMYHEEALLYYVTKVFQNGKIGKRIGGGTILDIGSNIGNHALYYAIECGASVIFAFEPVEQNYAILERNIALNQLEKTIKSYCCGVGEQSGKAEIAQPLNMNRLCSTRLRESKKGNIDIIAIDDLKLEQVDLIKIDVEGFELNVLKGALNTIKQHTPYITVEASDKDGHIYDIIKMLTSIGYVWEQISDHDYLFYMFEV